MKKDKADLLIAALRSGEYEQAQHQLRKEGRFCCLGVACDLFHKETGLGQWMEDEAFRVGALNGSHSTLPPSVAAWLGVKHNAANPDTSVLNKKLNITYSIAELNDAGWTFDQIADVIEREWETL